MREFVELVKNFMVNPREVSFDLDANEFRIEDDQLIAVGGIIWDQNEFCVLFDNRKCFNKASQCPIYVTGLPISRRKEKRLREAVAFLRTKEGVEASSTFQWYGWDEFKRPL